MDSNENQICLICYEPVKDNVQCQKCKSQFCKLCAVNWAKMKNQCPKKCHSSPWLTNPQLEIPIENLQLEGDQEELQFNELFQILLLISQRIRRNQELFPVFTQHNVNPENNNNNPNNNENNNGVHQRRVHNLTFHRIVENQINTINLPLPPIQILIEEEEMIDDSSLVESQVDLGDIQNDDLLEYQTGTLQVPRQSINVHRHIMSENGVVQKIPIFESFRGGNKFQQN